MFVQGTNIPAIDIPITGKPLTGVTISSTTVNSNQSILNFDQIIYTDGSCTNNGKSNSFGGIGVFLKINDSRNISEPLTIDDPTNQKAELIAIHKAVELSTDPRVLIITDSKYSVNSLTVWYKKWIKDNWKLKNGQDVKNVELIKNTINLLQSKKTNGVSIVIKHISDYGLHSHCIEPTSPTRKQIWLGNKQADKLSKDGSNKQFKLNKH